MKKLAQFASVAIVAATLAGCSTASSRMAECRDQGYSRNTCYQVEQNRQTAIMAASEKQAMENAQNQWKDQEPKHHHRHHDEDDD
ncbi:hypothetical protein ACJVQT_23175 [Enterobacter huaxiensis]|uniref:hypothetical protein n=1 Tax=Enterobacter huaxiensis TaxID=2494702 RepID=UPI002175961D|nr:hypothetical protein [Enterobacter huaxiensis]MCS5452481.1 hypothetical protein [Enterobacter huaxiensis]